jgi:hypothetical protein
MGKQMLGEQSLLRDWWPARADGLTRADADLVPADDVAMAPARIPHWEEASMAIDPRPPPSC